MSRLEKLLGLVLGIIMLGAIGIGLFLWQQSRLNDRLVETAGEAVPVPVQAGGIDRQLIGETGLIAYAKALDKAQDWQADVLLVTGQATWPIVQTEGELSGGKESWEFTLYSPGTEAAVSATVVNGQATLSQPRKISGPMPLHQSGGWQINSSEAAASFLENAGREFLAVEKYVSVIMHVDMTGQTRSGRPEILVAAVNIQNGHSLNLWLDATTGDVIEVKQDQ